ncbi:MAG: methyltransferase [Armatimonadetes bacterium]|nr:methyltransferase [Armatimonadota bacterium]
MNAEQLTVISRYQAKQILEARGLPEVFTSLDLGLTQILLPLNPDGAEINGTLLTWAQLKKIGEEERKCFRIDTKGVHEIRLFSEETQWVRSLCPTENSPTMLVSGIPMHRIKDFDPWADAERKVRAAGPLKGTVLDTATGLGYTAIIASKKADQVVTCELDPTGLEIARQNPWSQKLFNSEKITQIVGDVFEIVDQFPQGHFSAIVHDPPTIQFAGELYSLEFYRKIKRVLSRHGQFYHYIGDPESALGHKTTEGVIRRLHEAGFTHCERRPEAFGVTASVGIIKSGRRQR